MKSDLVEYTMNPKTSSSYTAVVHGLLPTRKRLRKMRKISVLVFSAGWLFYLILSPAVFGATGQEVLNEIQSRYEKTNDF